VTAEAKGLAGRDLAWLLVCGLWASAWAATAAWRLSPTYDEPLYLSCGLECWRQGHAMPLLVHGTMPLPVEAGTLPLFAAECCRGRPYLPDAEWPHLLPWARLGMLPFLWLLLAYAFLLGRRLGGPWGGRLAAALLALEPTVLGHAALLAVDLSLAAALLALTYHYREMRRADPGRGRLRWPVVWLAVALLCKVSAVVFGPLCLLAVEAERLARRLLVERGGWRALAEPVRPLMAVGFLGVVLAALYPHVWVPSEGVLRRAGRLPEGKVRTAGVWAATQFRPVNRLYFPVRFQYRHNKDGQGSVCYRFGLGPAPYWYYFPLALSLKLSEGVLVLGGLLVLRPRRLLNLAVVAGLVLLAYSFTARIQIGVRLVLPVIALLLTGVAAGWARAAADVPWSWPRRLLLGAAALVLLANARTAAGLWPDGVAYANAFGGGTEGGPACLSDSNYDWGQGLLELERYREEHGLGRLDVWHFGQECCFTGPDLRPAPLHRLPADAVTARVRGRRVAVSVNWLYAYGDTPQALFFRARTPFARTRTYFLYDFTADGPPVPDEAG